MVPPEEVGVKFDDIGALEDVKRTLNELVTLPMRRPELFSHGNLLRVSLSFFTFCAFALYGHRHRLGPRSTLLSVSFIHMGVRGKLNI